MCSALEKVNTVEEQRVRDKATAIRSIPVAQRTEAKVHWQLCKANVSWRKIVGEDALTLGHASWSRAEAEATEACTEKLAEVTEHVMSKSQPSNSFHRIGLNQTTLPTCDGLV